MLKKFFQQFDLLSDEDILRITAMASKQQLPKGAFFMEAGATRDQLGLVAAGCLRYFYLKDGEEITGEFWQEGELCGSFETSILGKPSSLFIEALEPVELYVFSYADLKKLAVDCPPVNLLIIRLLEQFIVESQRRIASYITEPAEKRYLRLREEMPGIEDRVHQKYIASFVGVTPVTLSRIRARLAGR